MSIVNMHKVTFIGMTADRDRLLTDLQKMGCVQIIPLASGSASACRGRAHCGSARSVEISAYVSAAKTAGSG